MLVPVRAALVLVAFVVMLPEASAQPSAQPTAQPTRPPAQKPPAKPAPKVKKDPKWTFEVFGGFGLGGSPSGESSTQFPAGATFSTDAGFPTRAVPSWYFGDGTVLFNEVRAQFASRFGVNYPAIVSLDPFFAGDSIDRGGGAAFGVRLSRRLTPRASIEFGLQRGQSDLDISDSGRAAIEAARASFEEGFRGLAGAIPQTNLIVTSTADLPETVNAPQLTLSAVLNYHFPGKPSPRARRWTPYVSAGLGYVSTSAETATTTLRGNYQFRFLDANRFNEVDAVTIRLQDRDSSIAAIFGGGAIYELSPRSGFRLDARVQAASGGVTMDLDAAPVINTAPPALVLPSNTNPSIQFSNTTATPSSLSGRISDQEIKVGGGFGARLQFTAGYYFRF